MNKYLAPTAVSMLLLVTLPASQWATSPHKALYEKNTNTKKQIRHTNKKKRKRSYVLIAAGSAAALVIAGLYVRSQQHGNTTQGLNCSSDKEHDTEDSKEMTLERAGMSLYLAGQYLEPTTRKDTIIDISSYDQNRQLLEAKFFASGSCTPESTNKFVILGHYDHKVFCALNRFKSKNSAQRPYNAPCCFTMSDSDYKALADATSYEARFALRITLHEVTLSERKSTRAEIPYALLKHDIETTLVRFIAQHAYPNNLLLDSSLSTLHQQLINDLCAYDWHSAVLSPYTQDAKDGKHPIEEHFKKYNKVNHYQESIVPYMTQAVRRAYWLTQSSNNKSAFIQHLLVHPLTITLQH